MSDKKKSIQSADLSSLTDFQFGPSWARPRSAQDSSSDKSFRRSGGKDRHKGRSGDNNRRFNRTPRYERAERPVLEPVAGIRAEIRPVDAGLASVAAEIHKTKRSFSLYDLAKLFMGARDRYEIWFIKEENGPEMISCKKSPAVWLDMKEATQAIWSSPWFSELYEEVVIGDHKTWKTTRDGSESILDDATDVEADFLANHFEDYYETTGKCHVVGSVASRCLSSGLFALLLKLVTNARRHPAQIIPNVCHGLARHHLPIFKWNNGHHTGPSRPHAIPTDTKLAERPSAIIAWVSANIGEKVDKMMQELAGIEIPTDALIEPEASADPDKAKNQENWVADLLWLLQQGYVIVTSAGKCYLAKNATETSASTKNSKKAASLEVQTKEVQTTPESDASNKSTSEEVNAQVSNTEFNVDENKSEVPVQEEASSQE